MLRELDWAQQLIVEMMQNMVTDDDAGKAFRDSFFYGESDLSYQAFRDRAAKRVNVENESYACLIFSDGSCYCDWKEGLDRFYPDADDLAAEERDSDPELANRIEKAYREVVGH